MSGVGSWFLLNALLTAALAVLAAPWLVGRAARERPGRAHAIWVILLLRLVVPPGLELPLLPAAVAPAPSIEDARALATSPTATAALADAPDSWAPAAPRPDSSAPEGPAELPAAPSVVGAAVAPPGSPVRFGPEAGWETVPKSTATGAPASTAGLGWRTAMWVWAGGSLLLALWGAGSWFAVRRLLGAGRDPEPELAAIAREIGAELGLARSPRIRLVEAAGFPPSLWSGIGRPVVALPAGLVESLTEEELRTVLLHELVHLARRDHWVRWLEMTTSVLYWWHPVVWWSRRALREAEERCCDRAVLARLGTAAKADRRSYARALLAAVEAMADSRNLPAPTGASTLGEAATLKERLTMILRSDPEPAGDQPAWRRRLGFSVLGAALLVVPAPASPDRPPAPDAPAAPWAPAAPLPTPAPAAPPAPEVMPGVPAPARVIAGIPARSPAPPAPPALPRLLGPLPAMAPVGALRSLERAREDLEREAARTAEDLADQEQRIAVEVDARRGEIAALRAAGREEEADRLERHVDSEVARAEEALAAAWEQREDRLAARRQELDRQMEAVEASEELRREQLEEAEALRAQAEVLREEAVLRRRELAARDLERVREQAARSQALREERLHALRERLEEARREAEDPQRFRQLERELAAARSAADLEAARIDLQQRALELEAGGSVEPGMGWDALRDEQRELENRARGHALRRGLEARVAALEQLLVEAGDDGALAERLAQLEREIRNLVERESGD